MWWRRAAEQLFRCLNKDMEGAETHSVTILTGGFHRRRFLLFEYILSGGVDIVEEKVVYVPLPLSEWSPFTSSITR